MVLGKPQKYHAVVGWCDSAGLASSTGASYEFDTSVKYPPTGYGEWVQNYAFSPFFVSWGKQRL